MVNRFYRLATKLLDYLQIVNNNQFPIDCFNYSLDPFNSKSVTTVQLAIRIFYFNQHVSLPESSKKKWQFKHFTSLVEEMRNNHLKCHYGALLEYYAPSDLDSNVESHRIAAFLIATLKRVFPKAFRKCRHFIRHLRKSKHFCLRFILILLEIVLLLCSPRFEAISENDLLASLKLSEIITLFDPNSNGRINNPSEHEKIKRFAASLLLFIFQDVIIQLIRYNFYVTESSSLRTKLLFYRHETWKRLTSSNLDRLLDSMFTPADSIKHMSQLRLVPKDNGNFRPIVTYRKNLTSVRPLIYATSV